MKETIINLSDYEQSGSGALGESYISKNDPNILLKLYSREREQMGYDEYERGWNLTICCVPSHSNNPLTNTVPPSIPPCAR